MSLTYIAIDQNGYTYHLYTNFPRKELIEMFGVSSAQKMYCDDKKGKSFHIGYIIDDLWLKLYKVEPFQKPA